MQMSYPWPPAWNGISFIVLGVGFYLYEHTANVGTWHPRTHDIFFSFHFMIKTMDDAASLTTVDVRSAGDLQLWIVFMVIYVGGVFYHQMKILYFVPDIWFINTDVRKYRLFLRNQVITGVDSFTSQY